MSERYSTRISVTNVWGLSDRVVARSNAGFLWSDQPLVILSGNHRSMVKPRNTSDQVYTKLSDLLLAPLDRPRRTLPSEQILKASAGLSKEFQITSTRSIPDRYRALCQELENRP